MSQECPGAVDERVTETPLSEFQEFEAFPGPPPGMALAPLPGG
jgi:hypothetical protein